ncbi:hypothetical protein KQR54_04785 [Mycobacterium gordonae]|uniref:WGxxGxxG family protein n=1 Tax=Mycobacterium gordonae TaxID=1778 RepID=UPI001D80E0F5|nr:WGxxGxxG family protein [Mycobacterium gordonae]MBI2701544.1 hypothetical protein [Mycobacterium sp.]MBX9980525.1 hypothetical protein [Mycobacterium gordonae]MCQ4360466.1 hypothetical protein [Mycobacterium gordonae]
MRNMIAAGCAATALLFGGAGIANASVEQAPAPSSTTTTLADEHQQESDNTGLWGLTGLLGLAGLAGLARRKNHNDATLQTGATRRPTV